MAAHTKVSTKRKSKASGGLLTRWFKEDWRDIKTGKKCGRGKNEKEGRTRLVDRLSESQVKHQRLLVKCLLLKRKGLKEQNPKQENFLSTQKRKGVKKK